MTAPTIEEIQEISDRTTDRLIELERRRQARAATAEQQLSPALIPIEGTPGTQPPRVVLAFLMGLSVGLSLGAVGAVIAISVL